jgi:hypothetical protein
MSFGDAEALVVPPEKVLCCVVLGKEKVLGLIIKL